MAQAGIEQGFVEADGDGPLVWLEGDDGFGRGRPHALGRQPRDEEQQQRQADDAEPEVERIDDIEQRQHRHLEPVDGDIGRHHRKVGFAALADHRLDQGQHDEHQGEGDRDLARRVDVGARHALHMHPGQYAGDQRCAEMDEGEQGEQAAIDVFLVDEVADQGAVEHRQRVEPFGGGDHHELGQLVPDQHEAVEAGDVHQPDQRHADGPGKPAEAAIAIVGEVAQHVQQHGQDHAVGGVAMDAAHDAAGPPLVVGNALDRFVGIMHPGVGEDVEIDAGADQQPELPEADGAQMVEGVQLFAEGEVEQVLRAHEEPAHDLLEFAQHGCWSALWNWVSNGRVQCCVARPCWKNRPPRSGLKSITRISAGFSVICASLTKLKPGLTRLSFIFTASL
jgi:hypothetical protein